MSVDVRATRRSRELFAPLIASTRRPGVVIVTAAVTAIVVLSVGLLLRSSDFDIAVVQFFNGFHDGTIGTVTNAVYFVFGPTPVILGTAVLTVIVLAITRNIRIASTFAAMIAATWLSLAVVKLVAHRPRPESSILPFPFHPTQVDPSYPSGHTAFVTALVVTIVVGMTAGRARRVAVVFGGLLIVFVGLSLVIDGVHYPSDVLASVVGAAAVAPLARLIWVAVVLKAIDAGINRVTGRRAPLLR